MKRLALLIALTAAPVAAMASPGAARFGEAIGRAFSDWSERDQQIYEERMRENLDLHNAILSAQNAQAEAQIREELFAAWQALGLSREEAAAMAAGFEVSTTAIATRDIVEKNGWRWGIQKALDLRESLDVARANEVLAVSLPLFYRWHQQQAVQRQAGAEDSAAKPSSAASAVVQPQDQSARAASVAESYSCTAGPAEGATTAGTTLYAATCPSGKRTVECSAVDCWLQ